MSGDSTNPLRVKMNEFAGKAVWTLQEYQTEQGYLGLYEVDSLFYIALLVNDKLHIIASGNRQEDTHMQLVDDMKALVTFANASRIDWTPPAENGLAQ